MLLQGFKELVERCHSEKTLNFEHKKNAEKMQMIRQNKLSGILACSIRGQEIVVTIEERIGQLNVDDLEARKLNSKSVLAEETSFIMFATGKHSTIGPKSVKFEIANNSCILNATNFASSCF